MEKVPDVFTSLKEAAEYARIGRQAVLAAIRKKRLIAVKKKNRWHVTRMDLDDYRLNKFNRNQRTINGELIFDPDKGLYSVEQVCKVISTALGRPYTSQRLYYLLRTGQVKATRVGTSWVISKEEAVSLAQRERLWDAQFYQRHTIALR